MSGFFSLTLTNHTLELYPNASIPLIDRILNFDYQNTSKVFKCLGCISASIVATQRNGSEYPSYEVILFPLYICYSIRIATYHTIQTTSHSSSSNILSKAIKILWKTNIAHLLNLRSCPPLHLDILFALSQQSLETHHSSCILPPEVNFSMSFYQVQSSSIT